MTRINNFMNVPGTTREAHTQLANFYSERATTETTSGFDRIKALGEATHAAYDGAKAVLKVVVSAVKDYASHGREGHAYLAHSFEERPTMDSWKRIGDARPITELSDVVRILGSNEPLAARLNGGQEVVCGYVVGCDEKNIYVTREKPIGEVTLTSALHKIPEHLNVTTRATPYSRDLFKGYTPLMEQ